TKQRHLKMLNKIVLGGLTLVCLVNIAGSIPTRSNLYREILGSIASAITAEIREDREFSQELEILKKGANRPKGYGMTAELANKKAAKFDPDLAQEAMTWIHDVLNTGDNGQQELAKKMEFVPFTTQKDVQDVLKDGIILCKLINIINPGSVRKINLSKLAFKQMENIRNFLTACENIGMNKIDLFQTVDVYEGTNIPHVINGIFALGRKAQMIGFDGPRLGPEEATGNRKEFSDEQLRAGEGVIGLQAMSNKGASQAGQNFGKSRAILD
ncbi:unnamed protein product, partial [Owenia fusiformis]